MQVFVVSWADPGKEQADWDIEAYAMAVTEAITAMKSNTRSRDLNLLALCSGAMTTSVIPLKRHAVPREVAGVVLMIVSDAGAYLSGESIVFDGGMTATRM